MLGKVGRRALLAKQVALSRSLWAVRCHRPVVPEEAAAWLVAPGKQAVAERPEPPEKLAPVLAAFRRALAAWSRASVGRVRAGPAA
jgi:hypothetical protein